MSFFYDIKMSRVRSRNWCFTLNNPTPQEEMEVRLTTCEYIVFGHEKGENETPHLQGYIEFKNAKDLSSMKKSMPRAHFEKRKGTAKQAADYCKKDGDFWEQGTISKQGHRTDLEIVADMVKEKQPMVNIAEEQAVTYIKFHRGIEALKYQLQRDRNPDIPPIITWSWGKTGVGKTRTAFEFHDRNVYIKDGTQWWNGYEQQEGIIIDDFDGRWPFRDLLRLLDRYPYQGQTKGGYVKINSPYIHITCSYPPERIWGGDDLAQIHRRLDGRIFEFV